MRRREFIALAGAAAAWPLAARAQQTGQVPRIAILDFFPSAASSTTLGPFRQGLRDLGYIEGRNIHVEYHSAEQRSDLAAQLAADFVRQRFDIIVTFATPAAHAAKQATTTVPIVIAVADALATGLVSSLARPGGNITGVTSASPDAAGKRLELLREFRPGLTRVAFLGATNDPQTRTFLKETQTAADSIRLHLQPVLISGPEEFEAAFGAMVSQRAEGLIVQPLFVGHRTKLVELANRHRLPLVADQRVFAESGAIATYGVDRNTFFRHPALYVDKILKGAKPSELPVEQPTKFVLVINSKAAKALGIEVPLTMLYRADEVIE
jgi:putative tryptophan/tyrosine transport system substrate-binding protein